MQRTQRRPARTVHFEEDERNAQSTRKTTRGRPRTTKVPSKPKPKSKKPTTASRQTAPSTNETEAEALTHEGEPNEANTENPPIVIASDSVLPSSPPLHVPESSPPPEAPSYSMSLSYSLRVNGREVVRDSGTCLNVFFTMDIIEDHVKEMIDSSAAGLQGREYQVLSRAISFRHSTKGSWRTVALEDFSYASGVRLFNEVDSASPTSLFIEY